ncbi:MAG: squalene/phytoene synthase family protein [Parabacteroides chartae]|nr:squalene/phytoene synthase family protein [Parabacteroides chartae]
MDPLYSTLSFDISRLVTQRYSTSFSLGITCFDPQIRGPIYSLYGFVRFADEIVDSFHEYDKAKLLDDFERDFYKAKAEGISLNPILNSFQQTVKRYNIDDDLIQAFISSMRSDLLRSSYSEKEIKDYIYGSADVVGLMCLKIFVDGNQSEYDRLKPYAMRLGSAVSENKFPSGYRSRYPGAASDLFPRFEKSTFK